MANSTLTPEEPKPLNKLAIWSISIAAGMLFISAIIIWAVSQNFEMSQTVANILSALFIVPIPLGLAAVITGFQALRKIKKDKSRGKWMAWVGMGLGFLGFSFFTFYLIFTIALMKALSGG
jgi:uncharacterized membrane protein YcjF (UPF0283 family)